VATIIKHVRDSSIQAYFAQQPFQQHQSVHIMKTLILNSGLFAHQYEQWCARPTAKHTWNNMENWATKMYDLWLDTSKPAANHRYGCNVMGEAEDATEAETAYAESLTATVSDTQVSVLDT
jgi:hypothetical protein